VSGPEGETCDVAILGGGLAGLVAGAELTRAGRRTLVLEALPAVGGLSRTVVHDGFRFDLGGHRFHTRMAHVDAWFRERLEGRLLDVERRSRICMRGRYVTYPLEFPNALRALSLPRMVQVLASYALSAVRPANGRPAASFEDWIVRRYGRALFNVYFKPYTEKVWGLPCSSISADWADSRIRAPSLAAVLKGTLLPRSRSAALRISRFLYPTEGIGMLAEQLHGDIDGSGRGRVALSSRVTALSPEPDGRWRVSWTDASGASQTIAARQVVSTLPLTSLPSLLPPGLVPPGVSAAASALEFRGVICVLVALKGGALSNDTWTYFPDPELTLGRIHEPANWSARMAPDGSASVCAEIFSSPGDAAWRQSDDALVAAVSRDLARAGLLSPDRIADAWVVREPWAYPVYRIGYMQHLERLTAHVQSLPGLHLCGRTGRFRYLNMDGVLDDGVAVARGLTQA
jgi:protoporphyrinogen oxidase